VEGPASPGDLLFFSDPRAPESTRVTHVAIALSPSRYLHCWGSFGSVTMSDLDPASDAYAEPLAAALVGIRRFHGKG
jgi:cell wall-associated NlpC family hydrolase